MWLCVMAGRRGPGLAAPQPRFTRIPVSPSEGFLSGEYGPMRRCVVLKPGRTQEKAEEDDGNFSTLHLCLRGVKTCQTLTPACLGTLFCPNSQRKFPNKYDFRFCGQSIIIARNCMKMTPYNQYLILCSLS